MEITKYVPINKGNLKAFVSVNIPKWGFYINGIGVCQKNDARWLNMPNRPYDAPDGTKKYANHCGFIERENKDLFDKKVFEALEKYLEEHKQDESNSNFDDSDCPF